MDTFAYKENEPAWGHKHQNLSLHTVLSRFIDNHITSLIQDGFVEHWDLNPGWTYTTYSQDR